MSQSFSKQDFFERVKKNKVLICAHRGTSGANVLQNSVAAAKTALLHGADIFEMDASMTADGVFFGFHDGHEPDILHTDTSIRDMTASEVEALSPHNALGLPLKESLKRTEEILTALQDVCYINIDRSWFYGDHIIKLVEQNVSKNQIILKSPVEDRFLRQLEQSKADIMYMAIIRNMEDLHRLTQYKLNLIAVELLFDTLDHPLAQADLWQELHDRGLLIWVNMITLSDADAHVLSARLDDDHLLFDGPENNLHLLQDMGVDLIQTDWPYIVKKNIK